MRQFESTDIIFDAKCQLHVLRHFNFIDEAYKAILIEEANVSLIEIKQILAYVGSKFSTSYVSNPLELFGWLNKQLVKKKIKFKNDQCKIKFNVNKRKYPEGIGYDNIVLISDLSKEEVALLKSELREDFNIISIQKEIKVVTWQINCILVIENSQIHVKTIFPGIMAPPFPDIKYQTTKDLKKNIAFWRDYAFIRPT